MLILKSFASERSVDSAPPPKERFLPQRHEDAFTFIAHQGFHTQILAYMLDSLVRVSRRVDENHFVSIPFSLSGNTQGSSRLRQPQSFALQAGSPTRPQGRRPKGREKKYSRTSIHPNVARQAYNRDAKPKPSPPTFPTAFSAGTN